MGEDGGGSVARPLRPRPSLMRVLLGGLRAAFLRPVAWDRIETSPAILAVLLVLSLAASIGISRLYFDGPVQFSWQSGTAGWGSVLLLVWACYVLRQTPADGAAPGRARGAAHLVSVLLAQTLWLLVATGVLFVTLLRSGLNPDTIPAWVRWAIYLLPMAWGALATLVLFIRSGDPDIGRRVQAVYAVVLSVALNYFAPSPSFWSEAQAEQAPAEREEPLKFTQELIEAQAPLLQQKVAALAPQRPGVADMYTITFAPFEGEEVFRRESRMVSDVMARRFDAAGRQLQLLNHADEIGKSPWATPLNLRRAIEGVARSMDRNEDVLFIHLTSHGAADGQMAANFWPLDVAPLMPKELKQWLDQAGIRHRVLSVSACYSGSWIGPLADPDTLVMSAADADHTSYGCGKKSELTFFGHAMYDEQIRRATLSFEQAHAAARKVIEKREKEAGKDDGYSNPQIRVGERIRAYLERFNQQFAARQAPAAR